MDNVPKLRFSKFTDSFHSRSLNSAVELQSGFAFKSELFTDSGTKLVTPKNFTKNGYASFVTKNTKYTVELVDEKYKCSQGDLLILLTDLTPSCELLGKPMSLRKSDGDVLLNQRIVKIKTNSDILLQDYLQQFFLTEIWYKRAKSTASGSTVRHSSNKIVKETVLDLPSIQEQQKIADFLSSVDNKISLLTEKQSLLQRYKKGVMQKMFSQELRFKDAQGNNFPDWKDKRLNDFCDSLSGHPVKGNEILETSNNYPLLRGINITEGVIRHNPEIDKFHGNFLQKNEQYLLKVNDVVIGMDGSKVGKNVAQITDADSGSFLIQRVTRLRSDLKNELNYVYHHITSNRFRKYVDVVNTSSGIPHISLKQIRDFPIYMPEPKEQQKIANFLSEIDKKIDSVTKQIERTKAFKKGLLQQMFV